jgi:hypothetical protein
MPACIAFKQEENAMNKATVLTSVALLLAACDSKGDADANDTDANAAVEAPAPEANAAAESTPAAAPSDGTFSAAFMVGKWSAMGEDCSSTIDFKDGGVVKTPIGDAKYSVSGDTLTFDYGDGSEPTKSTIKVLSPDRIEITRGSGGKETEKRCA